MPDTPPTDATTCPHGATPTLGAWIAQRLWRLVDGLCATRPPTVPEPHAPDCHTVHDPGCHAQTYDRATGNWTRCRLPAGHPGDHSDGCLQWDTVADFWAAVRQTTETP